MDYAVYEGIVLGYQENPFWLKTLSRCNKLICPQCGGPVTYVIYKRGQNHFKHQKGVVGTNECDLYVLGKNTTGASENADLISTTTQLSEVKELSEPYVKQKFSTCLSIHSHTDNTVYFKFSINWSGGDENEKIIVRTASGDDVHLLPENSPVIGSYVVDVYHPFLTYNKNLNFSIAQNLSNTNRLLTEHRFLLVSDSSSNEIISENHYMKSEVGKIYDTRNKVFMFPPYSSDIYKQLSDDGYTEVLTAKPVSISSRYITQLSTSRSLLELSCFSSISLINQTKNKIKANIATFDKDGVIIKKEIISLFSGCNDIGYKYQGLHRVEVTGKGFRFILILRKGKCTQENTINRFYDENKIQQIIISKHKYQSFYSRHGWKFIKIERQKNNPDDHCISKKSWNNRILGLSF